MSDDFLEVGRIVGTHGLKGEVKIYPDSDFPERFLEPGPRWLSSPQATDAREIQLQYGRYVEGKGLYIVKFAGVDDRTHAEALRDTRLLVLRSNRPPLETGEFYVSDLVGLTVIRQDNGAMVGTVIDVYSAGNDLLEVALSQPTPKVNTVLVPFVEAIVPVVDLEQQRVEITPPEGLFPST